MKTETNANQNKLILVTGATGKQGGAVLRHLTARGFPVRAFVRKPDSETTRKFEDSKVEVVVGDFDDPASVEAALIGVYGVFSVQTFSENDIEHEFVQGVSFADAAKQANVQHFVYSSVGSADRKTGVPHFDTKGRVEAHLAAIGLPSTILRPVFLMENWEEMRLMISEGTLMQPLPPERKLQQVCVDDLGVFATKVLETPDTWLGRAIDLAGDELTMQETAETFAQVIGRPVRYQQVAFDAFRQQAGEEMTKMYRWFDEVGYSADLDVMRKALPSLTTLREYLLQSGWK